MQLPDCPTNWQYSAHPDRRRLLPSAAAELITGILAGRFPVRPSAVDTQPVHGKLFTGLTPPGFDYFAGNYRGSAHRCLDVYDVMIPGDPLVGAKAALVADKMVKLGQAILQNVDRLEQVLNSPSARIPPPLRAVNVVRFACNALVAFLTIHPYADGNGHVGRALVWILLFRFGYVPNGWTVEPTIPGYGDWIGEHRRGNPDKLEQYVLRRISLARPPAM